MSRPGSHEQAHMQAYSLLAKSLPGTAKNRVLRAELAGQVAETIWKRWQVGIWQWRLKHLQWYLDFHLCDAAPSTRYNHWLSVKTVLLTLGDPALADLLANRKNATYVRRTGQAGKLGVGRPQKVAIRKSPIDPARFIRD